MKNITDNGTNLLEDESFNGTWVRDYKFWSGDIVKYFTDYCVGGTVIAYNLEWDALKYRLYKIVWSDKTFIKKPGSEKSGLTDVYHVQHFIRNLEDSNLTSISHLKFEDRESAFKHYEALSLKSEK